MKFSVGLILLLSLAVAVRGQSKTGAGSICIAPPDRPTTGEKSLANPAAAPGQL
jgi:hypothetical protein